MSRGRLGIPFTVNVLPCLQVVRFGRVYDSIFGAVEPYFAEIKVMVAPMAFKGIFSLKDIHGHVVSFGS